MRPLPIATFLLFAAFTTGCDRADPYYACGPDLPCGSDARLCLSDTNGRTATRFCTRYCTAPALNSSECPAGGACIRLNGTTLVCVKVCASDAECDFQNAVCAVRPDSLGARVCALRP